jgi:hypothetical protein
MTSRDHSIIDDNNSPNGFRLYQKPFQLPAKFFMKYSSVKGFIIVLSANSPILNFREPSLYFEVEQLYWLQKNFKSYICFMSDKLLTSINYSFRFAPARWSPTSQLAQELRNFIIDVVSVKEGHLGASLGVIELTIALYLTPQMIYWFGT